MRGAQPKLDLYLVLFTHLFSLVVGLAAAGVTLWVIATHQLLTLDGLALVATGCGIATFFLGHTAWAVHTGEIRELLANLRGKSDQAPPEGAGAPHDGK